MPIETSIESAPRLYLQLNAISYRYGAENSRFFCTESATSSVRTGRGRNAPRGRGLTVQVTDCDACLVYLLGPRPVRSCSGHRRSARRGDRPSSIGWAKASRWVAQHKSVVALANASSDKRFIRLPDSSRIDVRCLLPVPGDRRRRSASPMSNKRGARLQRQEISLQLHRRTDGGALTRQTPEEVNARLRRKPSR